MLKFNTFRAKRYLRSKFVEGKYLLASEATDLELEILDLMRKVVRETIGDVALADAWKVTKLSDTQILIKPGEAWFKGLPISFRDGKDHLVSGAILSAGIVPVGTAISDDATGLGKIVTFNSGGTTPTNLYRLVITAREELITEVDDAFLQNANITEPTAQKIRLLFQLNIVPDSLQTESPIPYRDENSTTIAVTNFPNTGGQAAPNLVNQIVVTPTAAGNGELLASNPITGSEKIDGRDLELILRNDNTIGGGRPIPNSPTEQAAFSNGRLIDSRGNQYHINAIFNDTISTQVVIRIDKEVDQPNPEIVNTVPFTLVKRDVFVTDDINGQPQGRLYWPIATLDWHQVDGIRHESKITDLRTSVSKIQDYQITVNTKFDLRLTDGGNISWDSPSSLVTWTSAFNLLNPHGLAQTIAPITIPMVDGGSLAYEMDLVSGGAIELGQFAVNVTAFGATSTLAAVNLSTIKVGNVIIDSAGTVAEITAIDDVNNTIATSPALTANGVAQIYLDSFGPGKAPKSELSFILAMRSGNRVYLGGDLELETGETSQLGDGVSAQLLTFIGSTGETDDSPQYSSNNYVTDGDSLVTAIGDLDAAVAAGAASVIALSSRVNEDRLLKLLAGGTWSWNLGTETLSWTANAFIQYPGFQNDRNQISAGSVVLNANEVAHVTLNRTVDSPTILTVSAIDIDSIVPTDDMVIFARRDGNDVVVGSHSFRLIDGESKPLDAGISDQNRELFSPFGITAASDAASIDWVGTYGAAGRFFETGAGFGLLDAVSELEFNLDRYNSQLRATKTATSVVSVQGADQSITADTSQLISLVLNGFKLQFSSGNVNFHTGAVVSGTSFTPFSIPVGEQAIYGMSIVPGAVDGANGALNGSILVTQPPNSDISSPDYPVLPQTGYAIAFVLVHNVAGTINVLQVIEIPAGGGSGGSGTGDANSITETLKNRLLDSPYQLVTPNIASQNEDDLLDLSSQATFSAANNTFEFSAAEDLITSQMLDPDEFLNNFDALAEVELLAFWSLGFVDTAATYFISRNGGNEYQAITMERVGSTDLYRGQLTFDDESVNQVLSSNAVLTGTTTLNATTQQKLGQPFVLASKSLAKTVTLELNKLGTPTGTFYVSLVKDNAGSPSTDPGDILCESAALSVSALSAGNNSLMVNIPDVYVTAGTYHIVIRTDAAYKSSFSAGVHELRWRVDTAASSPLLHSYNGTVWATVAATKAGYSLAGIVLDLRVKITSSAGNKRLEGLGIFYDKLPGTSLAGIKKREVFSFQAVADNDNEFTLTRFVPDPELLTCYYIQAGQVFKYPSFQINGQQIIFPVNSFNNGGVEADVTLVFDQSQGSSFDNSDLNALLLAGNFLGSSDPNLDRSVAGRGIFLRRPDGTLREITIDNSDNIAVYSV